MTVDEERAQNAKFDKMTASLQDSIAKTIASPKHQRIEQFRDRQIKESEKKKRELLGHATSDKNTNAYIRKRVIQDAPKVLLVGSLIGAIAGVVLGTLAGIVAMLIGYTFLPTFAVCVALGTILMFLNQVRVLCELWFHPNE